MGMGAPLMAPNAALLIDFDNVTMGIRSDLQTELRNLLSSAIIKGKVQLRRAYADWRRYPQYVAPLAESSIDMIMAPAYGSSKKNATDIRLAIDALELVFTRPEIGTFILLSGDSDFSTLVIKLKEYGKYVIGVGIRESSSDLLVMNCDEYYSYNALAGLVRAGSAQDDMAARRDPWELVAEAVARMQRNGDVMRADRLKQVMQDIDSSFDEKNLGMSKFSRFVQEAAHRKLLALTKLENGQLEIGPPRQDATFAGELPVADSTPPVLMHDGMGADHADGAAGEPAVEDRPRRSRRGRGGRRGGAGREREAPGSVPVAATVGEAVAGLIPVGDLGPDEAAPEEVVPVRAVTPALSVGHAGERLTREEAFDLVRRTAAKLVHGDEAVPAAAMRAAAHDLLGHDSESLAERNFFRILQDAHDAEVIDLRRRGADYEVALPAAVPPVAEQLQFTAASHAAAAGAAGGMASGGAAHPAPRGIRPRSVVRSRSAPRGRAAPAGPPPELLSVGVVEGGRSRSAPVAAPVEEVEPAEEAAVEETPAARPRRPRARGTTTRSRPTKTGDA